MEFTTNITNQGSEIDFVFKDYISKIFILDKSGIVRYSRSFVESINIEPQLLGSFLTALDSFVEITAQSVDSNVIKLLDVGTTHSRWFLDRSKNIMIVLDIPNTSPFLEIPPFLIVQDLISDLLTSYFYHNAERLKNENFEVTDDFDNEVMNILIEKVNNYIDL